MAKTITAPRYTCIDSEINVACNATSNAIQVRLPKAASNAGKSIRISKADSSANAITIIPQRYDTLDDGTRQVETATVVGTVVNAGNATVVLTSANLAVSPITLSVPVKSGNTASIVAGKIREALTTNALIGVYETGTFEISGSGATVVLTSVDYLANDATLNLSVDNGTCTGLTTAASSANTTSGSSVRLTVQNDFKIFTSDGQSWVTAETSGLTDTQTLTNKTLTAPNFTGLLTGEKVRLTPEGGIAVKMTNKTGGVSVKGEVVSVYSATAVNSSVKKIVVDEPAPIGVFYESGVADGSEVWVIVSGIADVYFIGNTTRGHLARGFITGDAGYVAGQVLSEAVPSSPFATDKHFYEIGHVIESRTGAGLAKCILHFN